MVVLIVQLGWVSDTDVTWGGQGASVRDNSWTLWSYITAVTINMDSYSDNIGALNNAV